LSFKDWVSNVDLQLFTDSAGGGSTPLTCQNGCGVFLMGKWCYFQWPKKWQEELLNKMPEYHTTIVIVLT
jgi:dihydrofolate reductase